MDIDELDHGYEDYYHPSSARCKFCRKSGLEWVWNYDMKKWVLYESINTIHRCLTNKPSVKDLVVKIFKKDKHTYLIDPVNFLVIKIPNNENYDIGSVVEVSGVLELARKGPGKKLEIDGVYKGICRSYYQRQDLGFCEILKPKLRKSSVSKLLVKISEKINEEVSSDDPKLSKKELRAVVRFFHDSIKDEETSPVCGVFHIEV